MSTLLLLVCELSMEQWSQELPGPGGAARPRWGCKAQVELTGPKWSYEAQVELQSPGGAARPRWGYKAQVELGQQ